MQTVVAIYTGQGLADPLKKVFQELLPDVRLYNIIDDSLIGDVVRAGHIPEVVSKHLMQYYRHAEEIGADVILNTCSSVGDVADEARGAFGVPIVRIDESMAGEAVSGYKRIAVLATLPSTLEPTLRLIQRKADEAGADVQLVSGLAEGAFDALVGGKPEEHDRLLLETAKRVTDEADVLVLAQGSMARMEQALTAATGKPVLSSPRSGVEQVKALLAAAKEAKEAKAGS